MGRQLQSASGNVDFLTNSGLSEFLNGIRPTDLALCLFVMWALMMLIEAALEWAKHKSKEHKQLLVLLEKTVSELMIVGMLAIFLFLLQIFTSERPVLDRHLFELLHMCLFLSVVLFLGILVIVLVASRLRTVKRWREFDIARIRASTMVGATPSPEEQDYFNLRNVFISDNELSQDFLFSTYLRNCLFWLVREVVEFDSKMWIFMFAFMLPLCVNAYFVFLLFALASLLSVLATAKIVWIRKNVLKVHESMQNTSVNLSFFNGSATPAAGADDDAASDGEAALEEEDREDQQATTSWQDQQTRSVREGGVAPLVISASVISSRPIPHASLSAHTEDTGVLHRS